MEISIECLQIGIPERTGGEGGASSHRRCGARRGQARRTLPAPVPSSLGRVHYSGLGLAQQRWQHRPRRLKTAVSACVWGGRWLSVGSGGLQRAGQWTQWTRSPPLAPCKLAAIPCRSPRSPVGWPLPGCGPRSSLFLDASRARHASRFRKEGKQMRHPPRRDILRCATRKPSGHLHAPRQKSWLVSPS